MRIDRVPLSPYGPARVEVRDPSGAVVVADVLTNTCNHCAVAGLTPDTRYTYSVTVKHEAWGSGVRWDWDPAVQGLVQRDRVTATSSARCRIQPRNSPRRFHSS